MGKKKQERVPRLQILLVAEIRSLTCSEENNRASSQGYQLSYQLHSYLIFMIFRDYTSNFIQEVDVNKGSK